MQHVDVSEEAGVKPDLDVKRHQPVAANKKPLSGNI
jgi:hypothetical protein